jgi:hypothetical protein
MVPTLPTLPRAWGVTRQITLKKDLQQITLKKYLQASTLKSISILSL